MVHFLFYFLFFSRSLKYLSSFWWARPFSQARVDLKLTTICFMHSNKKTNTFAFPPLHRYANHVTCYLARVEKK